MGIYVSELYRYPLKSGRAENMDHREVKITPTGIKGDRLAMLVYDEGRLKGRFVSQREKGNEKLALVKTNYAYQDEYIFQTPDNMFSVFFNKNPDSYADLRVHGNECKGIDGGDEAAAFFSNYLGKPVRLMIYPNDAPRAVNPAYGQEGDITSYADGFPFLITSKPSLQSLRNHFSAGAEIEMKRLRPNIVLDGNLPWEEDVMHRIRIGRDVEIELVKPCTRCPMTNVDQDKGVVAGVEHLELLKGIREGTTESLSGRFFGVNAIPRKLGSIEVGDKVEILSTRPMHPAVAQATLKFGI